MNTPPDRIARYGSSRGTRAIQALVEHAPATGGLALWMRHVDVEDDDTLPAAIANDGKTVFYAPRFERMPLQEQVGWVAHQTLHVAFRHVQRRDRLAGLIGDVDSELYNACADALVNSTLSHLDWLTLPTHAVYLPQLASLLSDREQSEEALLLQWDVERLYRAIDDRARRTSARSGSRQSQSQTQGASGDRSADQTARQHGQRSAGDGAQRQLGARNNRFGSHEESTVKHDGADGSRSAAVRALTQQTDADLLDSAEGERPEDVAEATREWAERLVRGHAADGGFSLLRTLPADVPRTRTPWPQILRRALNRGLIREPTLSWSRPSRSWLANRGRSANGRRMPWEPGTVTSRAVPRLALVLDVSGSIDDALLMRFSAQLNAITRRAGAQVALIVGDDEVRHERQLPAGQCGLEELANVEGGGGTDFRPLLDAASCYAPDYAVVLTDLDGPAGEPPGFPVLWAVPPNAAHAAPFGRVLVLDD